MEDETKQVVVTDIKMPFFSMVVFIIKWVFASIPAMIIVGLIFLAIGMGLQMSGLLPEMPQMSKSSGSSRTPPPLPSFDETE
jgi:hypothetical protein